jgi:predicted phage tail protein
MLRTVHLHGHLKEAFGPSYRFDVATAGEALKALNCAFPGKFVAAIREGSYKLVRVASSTNAGAEGVRMGIALDLGLINEMKLGAADLHLIPVAEGAAMSQTAKGTTKVVLGATLIAGAIFFAPAAAGGISGFAAALGAPAGLGLTYGNIALIGFGLVLAGVSTLLTKPAVSTASNGLTASGSGIGNAGQQGNAIPLIYGEVLVGSTVISVSSVVEDIDVYANSAGSIETAFGHSPAYWSGAS